MRTTPSNFEVEMSFEVALLAMPRLRREAVCDCLLLRRTLRFCVSFLLNSGNELTICISAYDVRVRVRHIVIKVLNSKCGGLKILQIHGRAELEFIAHPPLAYP